MEAFGGQADTGKGLLERASQYGTGRRMGKAGKRTLKLTEAVRCFGGGRKVYPFLWSEWVERVCSSLGKRPGKGIGFRVCVCVCVWRLKVNFWPVLWCVCISK